MRNDNPKFKTLLWDSAKTTGINGGAAIGAIAGGLPLGLAAFPLAVLSGSPAPIIGFFSLGTLAVGIPAGAVCSFLFALPFAISAKITRKFLSNVEIEEGLNKLSGITDTETKHKIITAIIEEDKKHPGENRSFESSCLLNKLTEKNEEKSEHESIEEKWSALNLYLNARVENVYVHNGKKLFNTVLNVAQKTEGISEKNSAVQHDEIERLKEVLEMPSWRKKGQALFGTKIPEGINLLRQCLDKYCSGNRESLVRELKAIAFKRLDKVDLTRDEATKTLYKAVINLGKEGNDKELQAIFSVPTPASNSC